MHLIMRKDFRYVDVKLYVNSTLSLNNNKGTRASGTGKAIWTVDTAGYRIVPCMDCRLQCTSSGEFLPPNRSLLISGYILTDWVQWTSVVVLSVCPSVSPFVTTVYCEKTADSIAMPCGTLVRVGPCNRALEGRGHWRHVANTVERLRCELVCHQTRPVQLWTVVIPSFYDTKLAG